MGQKNTALKPESRSYAEWDGEEVECARLCADNTTIGTRYR